MFYPRPAVGLGAVLLFAANAMPARETSIEAGVFKALNQFRSDPAIYVSLLESQRRYYHGRFLEIPGRVTIRTEEGVRAVDEAIRALRSLRGPLGTVALSQGLARAANAHVHETGERGLVGHGDFARRISQFGRWSGGIGEDISYGEANAREVIMQLLIDDGVRDRGHRQSLFDSRWRYVGIACGPHSAYRSMCVLDFAERFQDR